MTDLSPLLKVSARLLDLHDSRRALGESTQYQSEDRPGLGDGRYVSIAGEVLVALQASGKRSGDEFTSVDSVAQSVRFTLQWASDLDVEYVLNVMSRPTELRLLQHDEDSSHVIGDKETNLVEKAAHLSEYRLSRLGRKALAMAADNSDITYIEGDVTKLNRALETGRLKQALRFLDRLIDQLRTEQLSLISIIERTAGGRKVPTTLFDDLDGYESTMRRAAELVNKAQVQVDVLARGATILDEDVPLGLVRERVRELQRGIVGYARSLASLASKSLSATSTSVDAPSFASLALRLVASPPTQTQTDFILKAMGPVFAVGIVPTGADFRNSIKAKAAKTTQSVQVELGEYGLPPQDLLIEWLAEHQTELTAQIQQGGLSLQEAVIRGLAKEGRAHDFGCLVAALTSPDEWLTLSGVIGSLDPALVISHLPGVSLMYSGVDLQIQGEPSPETDSNDSL